MKRTYAPLRLVTAAVLALAALAACRAGAERSTAERVIRAYARGLVEAHLTRTMEPLQKVTSRDEYQRVEITLVGLSKREELLRASLEALDVRKASFDPATGVGTAIADERWVYQRVDSRTGDARTERHDLQYTLRYEFKRIRGDWVVDRVRFEGEPPKAAP